jgi:hypothetical protein
MDRRKRNEEFSNFETHQRKDVSGARRAWAAAASPERIEELFTSYRCHHHIHKVTILTKHELPANYSVCFLSRISPSYCHITCRSNIEIQLGRYLQLRIPNCNCSSLCHRNSNNHLQNLNQKMEKNFFLKTKERYERESERQSARERQTEKTKD